MRSARLLLLGLLLAALPVRASAEEPPPLSAVELRYAQPPGTVCPGEPMLHQEVARRMGYDPFRLGAADHLDASILREGAGLAAVVALANAAGVRQWDKRFAVRDENCPALIAAMSSHISYMLAPARPLAPAAPFGQVPAAPPIMPPPLPQAPDAPKPAEPKASRPLFEMGLSPVFLLGSAPSPAFGLRLQAGARLMPFSITAELRWDAPISAGVETVPGARIATTMLGGSLVPCGHISYFVGCALVTAGRMSGESTGVSVTKKDDSAYVGAGARAAFELRFTENLAGRIFVEGLGSIRNVQIVLDRAEVWHTTPVTGAAGATFVTLF
ncbi:MAG: hypothetical protein U0359_15180 [Byssovorax sp.]